MATSRQLAHIERVLRYSRELEQRARDEEPPAELIVEAVLLCAGKVQDLTRPDSAHHSAMRRILAENDLGSRETLRRMRGVLRAAAQLDDVDPDLHPPLE